MMLRLFKENLGGNFQTTPPKDALNNQPPISFFGSSRTGKRGKGGATKARSGFEIMKSLQYPTVFPCISDPILTPDQLNSLHILLNVLY